jgi:hypothetical protein
MIRKSALLICATVPVVSHSAACVRTIGVVEALQKHHWNVHVCSIQNNREAMEQRSIDCQYLPPNDRKALNAAVRATKPDIVLFDRFYIEEMFGAAVREECPQALRILDTQDLHALRTGREHIITQQKGDLMDSVRHRPSAMSSPTFCRELASIHRSDAVVVCSSFEKHLLIHNYQIAEQKTWLAPFILRSDYSKVR